MFEMFIQNYGDMIIRLILTVIGGGLGIFFGSLYRAHVNDDTKRAIAKAAVACVQQVWYALDGSAKMEKALDIMAVELAKKGIKFDSGEMWLYAEAAIAEFKEAFKKPVNEQGAAGAVYRVPEGAVKHS